MATFSASHLPSRQIEALLIPGGGSIGENIGETLKSSTAMLPIHIGFSGGVEMLFSNKKSLDLSLPLADTNSSNSDTAAGDAASGDQRPVAESSSSAVNLNRSISSASSSNMLISSEKQWTLRQLINLLTSRYLRTGDANLFLKGDNLRPGILVVVNDVDWELLGKHDYILQPNDDVMFISTLHGG